ncbi:MAG: protein kinase domain-containing protein [Phycisphaerales bacterium]
MTPAQRSRARALFQQLCDLPRDRQLDQLTAACGDDAAVRELVLAMLSADPGEDDEFEPLVAPLHAAQLAAAIVESPGSTIGPYRIISLLGEGGFGRVFLAEQEAPIRRRVALKVVKLGMDTRQVVTRFRQERQAMAALDHPNIAKVFDAGATDSGRPYFAMELCPGEPITRFCDQAKMPIHERLSLFCTVCTAVHHAHQRGLIHRDIKPSNILVAETEGVAVPKVIDFGIAKILREDLRVDTAVSIQHQFVGTPQYASPEQASGEADLDVRTDVYSLGVLLYELLTGELPNARPTLRQPAVETLRSAITSAAAMPPSTRVSGLRERGTEVSEARATSLAVLLSQLRRDLDWVVLRALEDDRERRYASAAELAADVQRYLDGQAVHAAPPSTIYAVRKFVGRHRLGVVAACLLALSIAVGFAGTALNAAEARREAAAARVAEAAQRELVKAEAQRSSELEQVTAFQAEMLARLNATRIGQNLTTDLRSRVEADLAGAAVAEPESTRILSDLDAALARINPTDFASRLLDREILGPYVEAIDARFADQPRVRGVLHHNAARAYNRLSLREECVREYTTAIDLLTPELGPTDPKVLEIEVSRLIMLVTMQRVPEAERFGAALLENAQRSLPPNSTLRLRAEILWGDVLRATGRIEESVECLRTAFETCMKTSPEHLQLRHAAVNSYTNTLVAARRLDEAESIIREHLTLLGPRAEVDSEELLGLQYSLARILVNGRRHEEAITVLDELLPRRIRFSGSEHAKTLVARVVRGAALQGLRRLDEAEAEFREVLRVFGPRRGVDQFRIRPCRGVVAMLVSRQEFAEAESLIREQLTFVNATNQIVLLRLLDTVYASWERRQPSPEVAERRAQARDQLRAVEAATEASDGKAPSPASDEYVELGT